MAAVPTGTVCISVDLGGTVATWMNSGGPLLLLPATDNACGALWTAEPLPATTPPPTWSTTSTIAGVTQTLPVASTDAPAFFLLKNKASHTYLSALYPSTSTSASSASASASSSSGDATTLFQLAANATAQNDALICGLVVLHEGQGAQANTLLVWLDAADEEPKAICMSSAGAVRAYAFPQPCFEGATGADCDLRWQACNTQTGYCADAVLLSSAEKTPPTLAPPLPLAFPNCVGRRLAGVFSPTGTTTTTTTCLTTAQLKAEVAAHAVGDTVTNTNQTNDDAAVAAFLSKVQAGLLVALILVFLVVLAVLVVRFEQGRRAAAAARLQLAKLRAAVHGSPP